MIMMREDAEARSLFTRSAGSKAAHRYEALGNIALYENCYLNFINLAKTGQRV
jgi:hypothetical protein